MAGDTYIPCIPYAVLHIVLSMFYSLKLRTMLRVLALITLLVLQYKLRTLCIVTIAELLTFHFRYYIDYCCNTVNSVVICILLCLSYAHFKALRFSSTHQGAKIWLTFGERQTIKVAVTALPILKVPIFLWNRGWSARIHKKLIFMNV